MIIAVHKNNQVLKILAEQEIELSHAHKENMALCLKKIGETHPNEHLVWCHEFLLPYLNRKYLSKLLGQNSVLNYNPSATSYLGDALGYIENTPFINLNKKVKYPTWQMSSWVGAIPASLLNQWRNSLNDTDDFDYFLNSLAKRAMQQGVCCYSDPKLLTDSVTVRKVSASDKMLYKFVKQHYKTRWVWFLLLNQLFFEKRLSLNAFLYSFLYRKRKPLPSVKRESCQQKEITEQTIDVIIPTLSRKKYLKQVLLDLNNQTHRPSKVIVVEQLPHAKFTELSDLIRQPWKFELLHVIQKEAGVCRARNTALEKIKSDWIFFADDDIRIPQDTIQKVISFLEDGNHKAVTLSCLQPGEEEVQNNPIQWSSFGTNSSIVSKSALVGLKFALEHEHGYGEDVDFGMQLRNSGIDILYHPSIRLTHLKAPSGGFRFKTEKPWEREKIQPKPAPTVMAYMLKHYTQQQLRGYFLKLLLQFYWKQPIKNPISYYRNFKKQFQKSKDWAQVLINQYKE